ncbi:MAG: DMT family transporter [Clostridiales bacterium]|nr:DMT family transporter [Clostridiales bacterium]
MKRSLKGNLLLAVASLIWGTAFVAQSLGMEYIGPFTFMTSRSFVGTISLLPVIALQNRYRKKHLKTTHIPSLNKKALIKAGIVCGLILSVASNLQQYAMQYTTAGKTGFLTALYILLVPLAGFFFGKKPPRLLWFSIAGATVGLYLLSVTSKFTIEPADLLVIASAFVFTGHIMAVDYYSPKVSGVQLSALQFLVAGLTSAVPMFIFENPQWANIIKSSLPILYAGVLSSGVAYTLQIIGQRLTTATMASLIMSAESVFALIGGMLILGESLTGREAMGAALLLLAIISAQLVQSRAKGITHEAV